MMGISIYPRKENKVLSLFVIACAVLSVNGNYVLTTPRRWTAGEQSQVCVTLSAPATADDVVTVGVKSKEEAPDKSFPDIVAARDVALLQGESSICDKFLLPDTKERSGTLIVTGSLGGSKLNFTKPINIAVEVAQTFVQTDKFLYKPSQTVQFRILSVVGPYLKISFEQYEEIWIENPTGTRISQWLNVPNEDGLIHLSFVLSDEPEEGTYKIRVRTPFGKIIDRTFKVEEYVLPKYEVKIEPPAFILGTSDNFTFSVCAKYTFGQPVKGNVTLIVHNSGWGNYKNVVKKESKISGCQKFTLNSTELAINGDDYFAYSLKANALVMEDGTGVELKANEASVDISRTALDFKDLSVQKFFKPELPFIGEVKVSLPDESPAVNEPFSVCCEKVCKNLTTNSNGLLKFAVPPHLEEGINIKSLNYGHMKSNGSWRSIMYESSYRKNVKKYHSPSNSSMVIALTDSDLKCTMAETIDFDLPVRFSSKELDSAIVTVQVISRGQIQFSNTQEQSLTAGTSIHVDDSILLEPLKEPVTKGVVRGHFNIPISLPKTVSPKAKVIVWYAREDMEVVSDSRELDISECLLNSVNLTWSTNKAQPGEQATLSIHAEPLSLCSLGVVDKSVQLLSNKENSLKVKALLDLADKASVKDHENLQVNDFTYCQGKYKDETSEIPPLLEPVALPLERRAKRSFIHRWPFYSDDVDSLHMFDEAGLYVLSDLTLETRPCRRSYNEYHSYVHNFDDGEPIPMAEQEVVDRAQIRPIFLFSPESIQVNPDPVPSSGPADARVYFPETWLWHLFPISEGGVTNEELTLPDTVTEWVGSAVCVHPTRGVGISDVTSITTFRDFFADLTLPASVKRGEVFPVKVSVFNYLKEPLPLKVVLQESPEYDILSDDTDDLGSGERSSCLPAEDKTVHSIRIRPNAVGDVNITVSAFVDTNAIDGCGQSSGKVRTDVLVKPIRVEIEGFLKEKSWSKYICSQDLVTNEDALEAWVIETPPSIIPDSARGYVTVVGDLMGPTLENLGGLVKMPYGCGEQNMLNFAPNIYVMQYLDAANINNAETAEKSLKFMEKGYQRELNYRHGDGSYSAFGERDDSGSTWLTAFVLKSFAQARAYINVDKEDLTMSLDWLKRRQLESGCFESVGKVLHKGMKGGLKGSDSPVLLSSFVLIALIEAGESDTSKTVRESLFCLNADSPTTNPYSIAVKAYALTLAGSPEAQAAIDVLLLVAEKGTATLHWEMPTEYASSKGVGVETAGYAVLALIAQQARSEKDYTGEIRKIIKWINNQRNGQGGFVSTQDTIVALQALAEFEKTTPQVPVDMTILAAMGGVDAAFTVNEQNKLLQQRADLPAVPTTVTFDMDGEGCVLLQTILRYNVPETDASEAFSLSVKTETEPDKGCKTKRITACAAYLLEDLKSNMAIIEVNLVSGYIPEKADLKRIVGYGTGLYKRYEVDGSVVTIYIDEFSPEEICVSFRMLREVEVEEPKPGSVKVYDYYKPEYFVTEKYTLPPVTECLNEGEEFFPFELEIIEDTTVADGQESPTTPAGDLGDMLDAFEEAIL